MRPHLQPPKRTVIVSPVPSRSPPKASIGYTDHGPEGNPPSSSQPQDLEFGAIPPSADSRRPGPCPVPQLPCASPRFTLFLTSLHPFGVLHLNLSSALSPYTPYILPICLSSGSSPQSSSAPVEARSSQIHLRWYGKLSTSASFRATRFGSWRWLIAVNVVTMPVAT